MRTRIFLYIIRVPHECRTYEPLKNSVPIGSPVPTAHQSTSSPPFRFAPRSPLTAAKYPFKPAIGSRKRCKLSPRGPGQSTGYSRILLHCVLVECICLQRFWFFARHFNEWQNESQSKLRSNLESPCNLQNGAPQKIGGPVRPNISNCPGAGLGYTGVGKRWKRKRRKLIRT